MSEPGDRARTPIPGRFHHILNPSLHRRSHRNRQDHVHLRHGRRYGVGQGFLNWQCEQTSKWLIIDGEMSKVLVKERSAHLCAATAPYSSNRMASPSMAAIARTNSPLPSPHLAACPLSTPRLDISSSWTSSQRSAASMVWSSITLCPLPPAIRRTKKSGQAASPWSKISAATASPRFGATTRDTTRRANTAAALKPGALMSSPCSLR